MVCGYPIFELPWIPSSINIMEFEGFPRSVDWLSSSGILLSAEKKSCLQSSLILMKRENKFSHVKLWGIIRGIQNDYYIAQGVGKDELDRKALYRYSKRRFNALQMLDKARGFSVRTAGGGTCFHMWMRASRPSQPCYKGGSLEMYRT